MLILNKEQLKRIIYKNKSKSYTYVLLRNDNTPYYVGVGIRNRVLQHESNNEIKTCKNRLKVNITQKEIKQFGHIRYAILLVHKDRNECLKVEENCISYFGRISNKTGILSNLTSGGEIGPTGMIVSEITRNKHKQNVLNNRELLSLKSKTWWDNLSVEEKTIRLNALQSNINIAGRLTSERMLEMWSDSDFKQSQIEKLRLAQQLRKEENSSIMKKKWADPVYREMMLGKRKEARAKKLANKNH